MSRVLLIFNGVSVKDVVRPHGHIDLLVGTDNCQLLPRVVQTSGKLQLIQNNFGLCVRGSHLLIGNLGNEIHHITVRTNHIASG